MVKNNSKEIFKNKSFNLDQNKNKNDKDSNRHKRKEDRKNKSFGIDAHKGIHIKKYCTIKIKNNNYFQ